MPVIDTQGRVFGRFNLVDALLVGLLIVGVPAAFGFRVLFRDPPAQLSRISPIAIDQGAGLLIELNGQNFRPYMRVSFGTTQAAGFQFYGTTQAFVPMPALEPGTYDVVLYDHAREVARLPQAMTVTGPMRPPQVRLRIHGTYVGLNRDQAAELRVGRPMNGTDAAIAVIEARSEPQPSAARVKVSDALTVTVPVPERVDVPATIVLTCPTSVGPGGTLRCALGQVALVRDVHITFQGPSGHLLFRIDDISPAGSPEP